MTYNEGLREDGHGRRGYRGARVNVNPESSQRLRDVVSDHVEKAKDRLREWGIPIPFSS